MQKIKKVKFDVDTDNRLVVKQGKKRLVADGRFKTGKENKLIYLLNEPPEWRRQYHLPAKIVFEGYWHLNPNYDLELSLDEYKDSRIVLEGEIISSDNDTLVFEIKSYDKAGQAHIQLLKLEGLWKADECNRINFVVKKKTSPDTLVLGSSWQLNQNQQITYTYEKTDLKTKTKSIQVLLFEGFWQIDESNRLTYILSRSSDSRFDFRAQIESPNIYPQKGVIKYRLGAGLREDKRLKAKIVTLYGAWKFSRAAGLSFEMDYGRGRIRKIEFGSNVNLSKKDEVTFSLTNKRKESLGMQVAFTHRFLEKLDAEAFVRLKKLQEENRVEAGVKIPF